MQCKSTCKSWVDKRGFGFIRPPAGETADIFVHMNAVQTRIGHGQMLFQGEPVHVRYVRLPDGRLRAVEVQFEPFLKP